MEIQYKCQVWKLPEVYAIKVDDLTKIYHTRKKKGNITALDSVSLTVEQGEIFGLLGPNGAGKTTLVKVLLNITNPNSGTATINGLPPENPESRSSVGYLPENHRFPSYLTGLGLLKLTFSLYKSGGSLTEDRSKELLELVGMSRWGDTKVGKYSKGMLQRIGLAQSLVADPELLILDEPTDGIDPVGKSEIKEVLRKLKNQGKTVLLNSHLLSEVEQLADRVAILSSGKLIRTGTMEEFTTKGLRYEIKASIGNERFVFPEEVGKIITIRTDRLVMELTDIARVNDVIDQLRLKRISIQSVQQLKISLEQSFMETVADAEGAVK